MKPVPDTKKSSLGSFDIYLYNGLNFVQRATKLTKIFVVFRLGEREVTSKKHLNTFNPVWNQSISGLPFCDNRDVLQVSVWLETSTEKKSKSSFRRNLLGTLEIDFRKEYRFVRNQPILYKSKRIRLVGEYKTSSTSSLGDLPTIIFSLTPRGFGFFQTHSTKQLKRTQKTAKAKVGDHRRKKSAFGKLSKVCISFFFFYC